MSPYCRGVSKERSANEERSKPKRTFNSVLYTGHFPRLDSKIVTPFVGISERKIPELGIWPREPQVVKSARIGDLKPLVALGNRADVFMYYCCRFISLTGRRATDLIAACPYQKRMATGDVPSCGCIEKDGQLATSVAARSASLGDCQVGSHSAPVAGTPNQRSLTHNSLPRQNHQVPRSRLTCQEKCHRIER